MPINIGNGSEIMSVVRYSIRSAGNIQVIFVLQNPYVMSSNKLHTSRLLTYLRYVSICKSSVAISLHDSNVDFSRSHKEWRFSHSPFLKITF